MNNQNRGFAKNPKGWRSGNHNRKSLENDQSNKQDTVERQPFFPDNQQASSTQRSSVDNKSKKYGNGDNFTRGNGTNYSQGPGDWHRGGDRGRGRAFTIKNNDREPGGNLVPNNASNQGTNSDGGSFQVALGKVIKTELDDGTSAKSFDKLSAIERHSINTKSGVFDCDPNLTDLNQSRKGDPDNPDNLNEKGKRQGHNGGPKKYFLREVEGDLFCAPNDVSLAHCVGADFRMGSGIAVRFRNEFQSVGKLFDQHVGPGGVAHISHGKRFIFYLVTKRATKDKPTNDTMRKSLLALHKKCKVLGVTKVAMPQIGCGMDGLDWNDVKQMLMEIFADGFEITVYKLDEGFVDKTEPGFKSRVVSDDNLLKDVKPGTGLLYISCRESFVSEEMKSINESYPFLSQRRKSSKLGFVVRTRLITEDVVYGLTCKESANSPLRYEYLERAIQELGKLNCTDGYQFFGLQAFEEKNDPFVMDKIETLFRNSGIFSEFWICWPPSLRRPPTSKQNYDTVEVQGGQYRSAQRQQSVSPQPSHSVVPSKDSRVKEVEGKMNSHSLADKFKRESENVTKMDWESPTELLEMKEPEKDNCEDEADWFNQPNPENDKDAIAYVDAERRRSREKKEAVEVRKQKEKQDRRSVKPKSCVTECRGDLFDAEKTMCLAHCVGADFKMGAGIAIIFRQQFGSVGELLDQRVDQGGVAYIEHGNRYIFYLVTKRESTGKPTYETVEKSLHALHKKCKELNVTELAMPRIGCGLDRLEWSIIKNMLDDIFADGFTIKIYNLEKPTFDSPAGGRSSSWGDTDMNRMDARMREMQRTMECTYRRLIDLSEKQSEWSGPDGYKASASRIEAWMDKMEKKIDELTSNTYDCIQTYENLQQRVKVLETSDNNLKDRVAFLENFLCSSGRAPFSDGGYIHPVGHLERPPPLVQNSVGQQVYPNHTYFPGVPVPHPGYNSTLVTSHVVPGFPNARSGPIYATDHLPEERKAFSRAVYAVAATCGYEVFRADENFFISRQGDRSDAVQINNYEDLNLFRNNNGRS